MMDTEIKLILGGLLHDIGKVVYRQGQDRRKHSRSGYEFLKNEIGLGEQQKEILEAVLYHHADLLESAEIEQDSFAYIIYIADNIASAADRRKDGKKDAGFDMHMPLQSIFNILNGNQEEFYYEPGTLNTADGINYPTKEKKPFDKAFYTKLLHQLQENLSSLEWTEEYVNSLLSVLEANLSYVPSSTAMDEKADISLYDHLKLTAAAGSCIYQYLQENKINAYRDRLFRGAQNFYKEEVFMLYSMDISGIQDFIYTIISKNALKTLRARSFYLEIMMEHIIDSLLQELHLSRANLIYSGGGHCYILLPNTERAAKAAENYMVQLNHWLMETFHISLYVAAGAVPCSANTLKNEPHGSYSALFQQIGTEISEKKSRRYSPADLRMLNAKDQNDHARECSVCKRIGKVNNEGLCPICFAIERFSKNILYDEFFTVSRKKTDGALPLPGGYYLIADQKASLKEKMMQDDDFVRAYSKNQMFTGRHVATKLWVGDYTTGKTMEEYAAQAEGIDRIAVLRADVDNLGQAFVSGFDDPKNQNRYVTLSRTASLSRQLSLFFKLHINKILSEPSYFINGKSVSRRNATICYSGGDDLFLIGSWNEVIELAVDIQRRFEKYTQKTLTISAGIGIYTHSYPISAAASEVGELEECAKALPGKNAVTIYRDGQEHTETDVFGRDVLVSDGTYSWKEFEQCVLGEKYRAIFDFFKTTQEHGKNLLYHFLHLIRNRKEKINFARYVYLLSRLEPERNAEPEQMEAYRVFSKKMYGWIKSEKDCRQLKTAIYLYAYMTREKEEVRNGAE